MTITLKSLEEEAAACREACAALKIGDLVLHLHHRILCESLSEPVENRIDYILSSKRDNPALRLRMMRPAIFDEIVLADPAWAKANAERNKANAEWNKAYAERNKANAERDKAHAEINKANAEWKKANAELNKAYAELNKAYAERDKANAELNKAYAERDKANAELNKAYAELNKANAERDKAHAERDKAYRTHYRRLFPDSPWDGNTIFTGKFAV